MLSASKLRWKEKQLCKYGHPRTRENIYFAGTGRNRMCKLCREARRSGIKREPAVARKYRPKQCGRGHLFFDGDDFYPPSYRPSDGGQRLCLVCEREKETRRRLADLRFLNGPAISSELKRSKLPCERVSAWTRSEASEYGSAGSRRRNPWSCHFTTPFIEPAIWQKIFAQVRPTRRVEGQGRPRPGRLLV